jgi:hypothetical protein
MLRTLFKGIKNLNYNGFLMLNRNWVAEDLTLFRKYGLMPHFAPCIKVLIKDIILAQEDFELHKNALCEYDMPWFIVLHEAYRDGLAMLSILLRNNPGAIKTERILYRNEFETVAMYTMLIASDLQQCPLELFEMIFYADGFDPNELCDGKTLLNRCITHCWEWHKIINILIEHPLLNINYVDKLNKHPLVVAFKTENSRVHGYGPRCSSFIKILLSRKDLKIDVVVQSLPIIFKWSTTQDRIYKKLFCKDRSYYRRFLWKTIRLIFIAIMKEKDNVWSLLPAEILEKILYEFGWEKITPDPFPTMKQLTRYQTSGISWIEK